MDFSHLLHSSIPQPDKMIAFGFNLIEENQFLLKKDIPESDFYAQITISEKSITVEVYEKFFDEKYNLIDVPSAQGKFVGDLREKVAILVEEIAKSCFESSDVKTKYMDFIKKEFSVQPDFPWDDLDETAVIRCPNGKWFGLVMKIPFKKLGFESETPVWVVNIKADKEKIPGLIDKKSIFPAWHMNKKYWITILLTSVTDFEKLCELTRRSYELVNK